MKADPDIDLIILHEDLRALGYCNHGVRTWAARYGLEWGSFLANGMPYAEVMDIGDSMVEAAADVARKRVRGRL